MGSTNQTHLEKYVEVFDLSAEFHGISINKPLLSGPDWKKKIVGVLLTFKKKQIGITGDTEAMYH